jgi:hypothetical protein
MKAEITRDVISDLWPVYQAGEASADAKRLVETFLEEDPEFRILLDESEAIRRGLPDVALSMEAEMRMVAVSRERIRATTWLVGAAIGAFVFVSMSFLAGALFFALRNS